MRLALYVTCLVDLMRPSVGFAALRLLEASGGEVFVPEGYDAVVIPSGSCVDQIRNVYCNCWATTQNGRHGRGRWPGGPMS